MRGWILYNADGKCIGRGDGETTARDGETLVYSNDLDIEPDVLEVVSNIDAMGDIMDVNGADRSAIFEEKSRIAKLYLDELKEALPHDDKNVIDYDRYPTLYDEYWLTYDLVPWTPVELATKIVDTFNAKKESGEFQTASQQEAERRRAKLLAELSLYG